MLPIKLRITLIIAVLVYFVLILYFLKKKALELKYTLLWLFAGVVMGICVFFPKLLYAFVKLIGIATPMNGLYIICIGFIVILMMSLTSIVSKQAFRIRSLVQDNAMLEKRIRELETKILKEEKNDE